MKSIKRALALLLAALLILSAPALATEAEIPADSPPAQEQALSEDAAGETIAAEQPVEADVPAEVVPAEALPVEAAPVEDVPAEDVPAEALPAGDAPVEDAAGALPAEEEPEAQEGGDILAEAAGELPDEEIPEEPEPQGSFEVTEEAVLDGAADNDALFQGYAADVLGLEQAARNRRVGQELSGANGRLYAKLVPLIQQVAAGQRTSTEFTLAPADIGVASPIAVSASATSAAALSSAIGLNFSLVMDTLTSDYPYELYWFDKTLLATITYKYDAVSGGVQLTSLVVRMQVCKEYAAGSYVLSTAKLDTVKRAAANAQAIVASYRSKSDAQKLQGYVSEICSRVTYNSAAVRQVDYGNPWQIVWVFDGDPGTNVVCEGYAKALKYLCDLTSFAGNVHCYTMTGTVSGIASGAHMWNVVTLPDGRNCLVDATFADGGYAGLALAAPSKVVAAGKSYSFNANGRTATYTYDALSMSVFPASVRTLTVGTGTASAAPAVQSVSLSPGGTIRLVVGESRSLKASFSPAGADPQKLTWASSNSKVVAVSASGVIKAKKKGKAVVAVRTANGRIAKVTVQVAKKAKVKKVALSPSGTRALTVGNTLQLTAGFSPWNGRAAVKWASSNKAVAQVSGSGLVRAVGEGSATITVITSNKKKASMRVTVTDPNAPNEVRVWYGSTRIANGSGFTMQAGGSLSFTAAGYLNGVHDASRAIAWSSSNSAVATVSGGRVVSAGPGTAVITVRASSRASLQLRVTVTRNRIDGITARPSAAACKGVKSMAAALKSVEILGPNRIVAEIYFVNGRLKKAKGIKNFRVTLTAPDGAVLASGGAAKYKCAAKKGALKTLKVVFTGSQVKRILNLSSLSTVSMTCSGTLY